MIYDEKRPQALYIVTVGEARRCPALNLIPLTGLTKNLRYEKCYEIYLLLPKQSF
jgi:hypothetical protein